MGFENNIQGFQEEPPVNPEQQVVAKKEELEEPFLEKLRKNTGKIARGLAIIGALSVLQPGDKLSHGDSAKIATYERGRVYPPQPTEWEVEETEKKLDRQSFKKLCSEDPEKAFVTASLYRGESWLGGALLDAVKLEPIQALKYWERFKDVPEYETILSSAVDSIKNVHSTTPMGDDPSYILSQHADAWINLSFADKLLDKFRSESPNLIVSSFSAFSKSPKGYKIGKEVIESLSQSIPGFVLEYMGQFSNEPWAEKIITQAADKEPFYFIYQAFGQHEKLPQEMLDKITLQAISDRPDLATFMLYDAEYAMDERDYRETDEGRYLVDLLQHSDDVALRRIPEIRKMIPEGKLTTSEAASIAALIDYIASDKITVDEAKAAVHNPSRFLNLLMQVHNDPKVPGRKVIEKELREIELKMLRELNNRHELPDTERFVSVENMAGENLYALITYGEEEVFTSTFNGLFDRLVARMRSEHLTGTQLMERVQFGEFRTFVRSCTEFGRLGDFLGTMSPSEQESFLHKFAGGLENAKDPVREAVAIAEAANSESDRKVIRILRDEVKRQMKNAEAGGDPRTQVLYKLVASTLANKQGGSSLAREIEEEYRLPELTGIHSKELLNPDGSNVQQYFFYNDNDGEASFESFLHTYRDGRVWQIRRHDTYVEIDSKSGTPMRIYANMPKAEKEGTDAIEESLKEQKVQSIVVVHRGHSFHAKQTIERIPPTAKIVSLGSCGGYRNLSSILERVPNAHIISTKGTGSMFVNDPLLKLINEKIRAGQDIVWEKVWEEASHLIKDKEKFDAYVAPDKNFGAIFIKAYEQATKNMPPRK